MKEKVLRKVTRRFKGDAFAIPLALAEQASRQLKAAKLKFNKGQAECGPFTLDVAVFSAADNVAVRKLFKKVASVVQDLRVQKGDGEVIVGERRMQFFVGVANCIVLTGTDPKDESRNPDSTVLTCYRRVLQRFSRLVGGTDITFHVGRQMTMSPALTNPWDLHVYDGCSPSGESNGRNLWRVFGKLLECDGTSIWTAKPAPGRGVVLKDGEGHEVVQVVGTNFYLLPTMVTSFNLLTSEEIFVRLLALAWQGWRTQVRDARPVRPKTMRRGEFVRAAGGWMMFMRQSLDQELVLVNDDIQKKLNDLARLRRKQEDFIRIRERLSDVRYQRERTRGLGRDYDAIRAHPDVASILLVENGVQVNTRPIVIEYEGRRYPVGRFAIRISDAGWISVWSEESTHPRGVPHPHIPRDGGPCFGNATDAIHQAAGQYRFADAVRYTLTWLTKGYTHPLAENTLDQWAWVDEEGELHRPEDAPRPTAQDGKIDLSQMAADTFGGIDVEVVPV